MTDKKEKILISALELFANEGYDRVSTSKIAKMAVVSEGLIFRHFGSKKELLMAIMSDAEQRYQKMLGPIVFETEPKKVLRKLIELPRSIEENEFDYWRLQFKLKWQAEYNKPDKMRPLLDKLEWAFEALAYVDPKLEAFMLNQILDAASMNLLSGEEPMSKEYEAFLLKKYGL